jgi:lactate dehydrogenase-like 2-hydroxyacid dehydrogenase
MKIGYFGKQNSFALEMLRRLKLEHSRDEFVTWQPGNKAPSTELEVITAFGKADSKDIEDQTKLGLIQMACPGYEGVDVDAATKAGVWVGSAPTTKTGNGESVAEVANRERSSLRMTARDRQRSAHVPSSSTPLK